MHYRRRLILAPFLCLSAAFAQAAPPAAPIQVSEAWSLPSLSGVKNGVAYVTLANTGAEGDALIGVASPVAEKAELHTQEMTGDILRMREVKAAPVASGRTLAMKPGGLHIMLISTTRALQENETFPLTLTFRRAGDVTTDVKVRARGADAANAEMEHEHMHHRGAASEETPVHAEH